VPATGVFEGWCGNQDRYLIWDEEAPGNSSRLFDPDSDNAETKITMAGHRQCDTDGDNIVFVDRPPGAITKFDVGRGSTETLALYQQLKDFGPSTISISPDLKSVAFDPESVRFNEGGPHLKLLPLTGGVQWKSDGSMLFVASNSDIESISVIDTRTAETFQGKLPIGFNFMDGGFLDSGRELMVFMRPRSNLPSSWPPGTLFRCSIAPFKCRPIVASVDDVSMNEHGLIGAVTMIYNDPRHRYDSDSFLVPNKYVLTVMNADGRVLIKQELPGYSKKSGRANLLAGVQLHVSPSGRRVILEWNESKSNQKCETDQGRCVMREIVELPKRD
jgi:hypothetical protein